MQPPSIPSQALYRTTSSLGFEETDVGDWNSPPSSARQLTELPQMSSQTYTTPSSSQAPVSARLVDNADLKKAANQMDTKTSNYPIFSALKETTHIYDSPLRILEQAAGDVIREDGFISLVGDPRSGSRL